ncbi:HlyD family secretion protein [Palleronia sp. LCG004]|uniref:HlyD family secretion protein n=1 Tax=Palleronia sp. LCG004 TaxID=3079304 RepID=UPI0029431215|nr:HlyD family efflux transporter periplasmic adaptor subunit [Palleronia sp. LCG004]WOI57977.1 HlyD family efflux transporter periplasmic adaptor subunit [Palleronia sp. LCG004]
MRLSRLVIGFTLIVVAVWIIAAEQMAGASADAVVNARLTTLSAPIAGRVELGSVALGSGVDPGAQLASITDPMADTIRLEDLEMESAFAAAEIARIESVLASTAGLAKRLETRSTAFTDGQIADLALRLDRARERLDLIGGDADVEPGTAPAASLADSRIAEEFDLARNALSSAEGGVFIGNGYNDAPNAETRRVELLSTRAELEAALEAARARATAIEDRLDAERISVNRLGTADIASNVQGRIWEILAADGEQVQRGEPVLRLLDCRSTFVTLSVTETIYNRLRIGDAAEFRLSGTGETYPGTVIRLGGSGAATLYRNLAVAPGQAHLERFDVALSVPGLMTDPTLGCPIGRTGRAFFTSRPLDPIRNLF